MTAPPLSAPPFSSSSTSLDCRIASLQLPDNNIEYKEFYLYLLLCFVRSFLQE